MFKKGKRVQKSNKKIINLIIKNKISIISLSILFILLLFQVANAFFSDRVNKDFTIGGASVSIELQEDAPFNSNVPQEGADTRIKTFRAVSTGTANAYVRAEIIPVIEYFDENENAWVVANVSITDIEMKYTAPNWIENNGYYYYKNILTTKNSVSEDFIAEIISLNLPDNFLLERIRVTIKVRLEAAQANNDKWREIFDIVDLPEEVEK